MIAIQCRSEYMGYSIFGITLITKETLLDSTTKARFKMNYYKVVHINSEQQGRLESYCHNPRLVGYYRTNEAVVVYKPLEWVKPNIQGSKLFVFDSLKNAEHFAGKSFSPFDRGREYDIWVAQVKNPVLMRVISEVDYRSVFDFWNYWGRARQLKKRANCLFNSMVGITMPPPAGTYGCSAVKLISRTK